MTTPDDGEFSKLLERSSLGAPNVRAIQALAPELDLAAIERRLAERTPGLTRARLARLERLEVREEADVVPFLERLLGMAREAQAMSPDDGQRVLDDVRAELEVRHSGVDEGLPGLEMMTAQIVDTACRTANTEGYRPHLELTKASSGDWTARIPVLPPRERGRMVKAVGHTVEEAVRGLHAQVCR